MRVLSPEPEVRLVKGFDDAYRHAVAAARTCYSAGVVDEGGVTEQQMERIGKGCLEGGHHTVFQHACFNFAVENVSRHFAWAFLHAHPFYNSSQSSQRYVRLKQAQVTVPPLKGSERKLFLNTVENAWEVYDELTGILEKDTGGDEKKAMEIARYVIPIAAHTSLSHTVSGITLYRLHKLSQSLPVPWETEKVVGEMVKAVGEDFFRGVEDPVPLKKTLEYRFMQAFPGKGGEEYNAAFDEELEGRRSKLVSCTPDGDKLVAEGVRNVTGREVSDEEALDWLLSPGKDEYLDSALNVSTVSPLMRAMNHCYFVFKKRISHTADSQNQRHRMTPATRSLTVAREPDYVTPDLVERNERAKRIYGEWMEKAWNAKNELLEADVPVEYAQYVLPNALAVRIIESGSFLNLWHKWRLRLCLTAQREIWKCSLEEVEQVRDIFPNLVKHVGPNCMLRFKGGRMKPFCTEGPRWCGKPVWTWKDMSEAL
jgi:thymidylate synthase ThyX